MRTVSVKPDIKILKSVKKISTPKKKNINDLSAPIRDTISETISFVIKGKLTPIKPILVEKRRDLTFKRNVKCQNNALKKSEEKPIKIKQLKAVKSKVKSQPTKAAKKISVQSNCKNIKYDKVIDVAVQHIKDISTKNSKCENLLKVTKKKLKDGEKTKAVKKPSIKTKGSKTISKKSNKSVALTNSKIRESVSIHDEDEIKKQQTIQQLLKQVNEEIKSKESKLSKHKSSKVKKRKKNTTEIENHSIKTEKILEQPAVEKEIKLEPAETAVEIIIKQESSEIIEPKPEISLEDKKPEIIPNTEKLCLQNTKPDTESTSNEKQSLKKKKYIKIKSKPKVTVIKNHVKSKTSADQQICKKKLFKFWNGPKRHRVASLNALAKVHCLYENETRATILDVIEESNKTAYMPKRDCLKSKASKNETLIKSEDLSEDSSPPPTRILRSLPGLRAVGKHWDMHDTSSSDEDDRIFYTDTEKVTPPKPKVKKETTEKKRKTNELVMDLKDMVVRKRMASLNASAILAASYSPEKRQSKSKFANDDTSSCTSNSSEEYFAAVDKDVKVEEDEKKEDETELIEVRTTPNNKVAVIVNQDTDVTITGVYVNSTTRSTHHEGYCSIAGMQYRISATSHTQTAATAVSTEALLQSSSNSGPENSNSDSMPSSKSYTPLDALSNMQPPPGPGIQHNHPVMHGQQHMGPPQHVLPMPPHQLSPGLRHSCSSAFSSPHSTPSYQTPPTHHPPIPESGFVHAGYYQPAGPLITVQPPPHGPSQPSHSSSTPLTKTISLSETSPSSSTTPSVISHDVPPPPPSSTGDSSDSEVIITSVTTAKDNVPPATHPPPPSYRYPQYPGYSYPYPSHTYPYPTSPPNPPYSHHDMCYSPHPYVHKYPVRRYLTTTQFYPPPNPQEIYQVPPPGPSQQNQQVVTTTPVSANAPTFPAAPPTLMETYASPPATLVESYQPPPPSHYYPPPAYGPPAPPCYSHPSRTIPYINAYQSSCPCPMQSCPKNVHTGPLTGDCKRSNITSISKDSMPLPPVALALPLEPASATGPPSPARGSAGMPPPPSPAGATYQTPPVSTKQESESPTHEEDCKTEKKRKARIGKQMVRNNIAASLQQNTMLLMCNPQSYVKREIESPKESDTERKRENSDEEAKSLTEDVPNDCPNVELEKEESQLPVSLEVKEEKVSEEPPKPLLPVINTVAENVKVKNMKRKLSVLSDKEPSTETSAPPKKKQKRGSYKLLIKKDTNAVKINNGKLKLLGEIAQLSKKGQSRKKLKKQPTKRRFNLDNEETVKRRKLSRLYLINNINSKSKEVNPSTQTKEKKSISLKKVNSKCNSKTTPAPVNKTLTKSNVELIIESVISDSRLRTQGECASNTEKCSKNDTNNAVINKKSTNKIVVSKKLKINPKKTESCRKKTKCNEVTTVSQVTKNIKRPLSLPRWSNGWTWEGDPFEAKVFLNSDELTVERRCFPAMRHESGDRIFPRDCVLLKAGPRKNDLPFVAKIASLWENPEDGEMMMSLLWYYRPEHTEQGRMSSDQPDEVFASRHKDSNSVACIDDKCYVLTFNEYCRYRKTYKRIESGIEEALPCIPNPEPYPRSHRQPPMTLVSPEMVFFCRRVYDFRQKRIMKNPT